MGNPELANLSYINLIKTLKQEILKSADNLKTVVEEKKVRLYREFSMAETSPPLTWSHYSNRFPFKDKKKREAYVNIIKEEFLSVHELKVLLSNDIQ